MSKFLMEAYSKNPFRSDVLVLNEFLNYCLEHTTKQISESITNPEFESLVEGSIGEFIKRFKEVASKLSQLKKTFSGKAAGFRKELAQAKKEKNKDVAKRIHDDLKTLKKEYDSDVARVREQGTKLHKAQAEMVKKLRLAKEKLQKSGVAAKQYAKDNPKKSLAAGAAAGIGVGSAGYGAYKKGKKK